MRIHLLRHAKAWGRQRWQGPDVLRPLAPEGRRQAAGLVSRLDGRPIARIVSSPHVRCWKTVGPLAAARRLPIEIDERVAEGEPLDKVLELLAELGDTATVVCSHGDLILALLDELVERGAQLGERCAALLVADHRTRMQLPGMQPARADLLPTAALVLESVAQELDLPGFWVSDWGLREGVLLEMLGLASSGRDARLPPGSPSR